MLERDPQAVIDLFDPSRMVAQHELGHADARPCAADDLEVAHCLSHLQGTLEPRTASAVSDARR